MSIYTSDVKSDFFVMYAQCESIFNAISLLRMVMQCSAAKMLN